MAEDKIKKQDELLFLEVFFVELVLLFDFVFCHSGNI